MPTNGLDKPFVGINLAKNGKEFPRYTNSEEPRSDVKKVYKLLEEG